MSYNLPMLFYLRLVLDEHTISIDNSNTGITTATWLVEMFQKVQMTYHEYDTI